MRRWVGWFNDFKLCRFEKSVAVGEVGSLVRSIIERVTLNCRYFIYYFIGFRYSNCGVLGFWGFGVL